MMHMARESGRMFREEQGIGYSQSPVLIAEESDYEVGGWTRAADSDRIPSAKRVLRTWILPRGHARSAADKDLRRHHVAISYESLRPTHVLFHVGDRPPNPIAPSLRVTGRLDYLRIGNELTSTGRGGYHVDELYNYPRLQSSLDRTIRESESLLDLEDNWDEEGARPISFDTWQRATVLLRRLAQAFADLPVPTISACANGSVDLLWSETSFSLLVNIRPVGEVSDFAAETKEGVQMKGPFSPEDGRLPFFEFYLRRA